VTSLSKKAVTYAAAAAVVCALVAALTVFLAQHRHRPSGWRTLIDGGTGPMQPSVILITVDTLRADHLGSYGYPKDTSPNIDQFAQEALLFENCLSHAPETRTSIASILTGFLPHETGVLHDFPLPADVDTLPEMLERVGYKTLAVVSNYVLQGQYGWDQGFIVYDDTMTDSEAGMRRWPERIAERTTDRAIQLLSQYQKDRLFMWIHYQDPHGPYTPPDRFAKLFEEANRGPRLLTVNRTLSGLGGIPVHQQLSANRDYYHYVSRYDGEIRYLDAEFQRLIDAVKTLGLYEDSLILFTADHGEGMGEHNFYFSHIGYLYNALTHVPLIIRHGTNLIGRRTDFVQHIDIVPAILTALGLEIDPRFRGRDLRQQHWMNKEIVAEARSPFDKDGDKSSVVVDGLKLIHTIQSGRDQLFDLQADPHEEHDLAHDARYRERLEDLRARLNRIRTEDLLGVRRATQPRRLSEEEKRKLKSLGYVQ
jgi:arylsulfatase